MAHPDRPTPFIDEVSTPIGRLTVAVDDRGRLKEIRFPGEVVSGIRDPKRCSRVTGQLAEYFAGARTQFDLDLAPEGTPFQHRVWDALMAIPVVIPCHRVIASDGSLGGYAGGLALKSALLDMEGGRDQPELRLSGAVG